jgi:hypothetical protein
VKNKGIKHKNLWDAVNIVLRNEFIAANTYIKVKERSNNAIVKIWFECPLRLHVL